MLFEYAEKDVELVCGSLVTIRQGTLQVIHLSVKEFLTSTHGLKNSTYSKLLIDPAKASLQLTLVCLMCIKSNCNQSFASLDPGVARLDIELDRDAVVRRQRQAPLAEYASLTWMMHMAECDGNQMIGLSRVFKETFDPPSTFYWVEACLAFQPDSVLHLLAGLEEVNDYVSGLGDDQWPESEASCVFTTNWCHALRDVFEEYGPILSRRPWEVHFLDLQSSFSRINRLYEAFGNASRRDATLRINGYKSPRTCRREAQAQTRLQRDVQGGHSYSTTIFFIHDERRKLYFWGDRIIDFCHVRLFVQNATTGQRLPPAVMLDGEAGQEGSVASYGLSPSGDYIVVVYSTTVKDAECGDDRSLTLVWHINEEIRFKKRLRSEPWGRVIFSHQCEIGLFQTTTSRVVFLDGGYCLTPCGEIHLASGSRRPLLVCLSTLSLSDKSRVSGSFYSQNGKHLFISEVTHDGVNSICRAIRVAPFTEGLEHVCSWKDSRRRLADVSPSGRFLILENSPDSLTTGRVDEFLYLYDVDTSQTVQLPFLKRLDYCMVKYQFMEDETELILLTPWLDHGISVMEVFVWSSLQSNPLLRTRGQLKMDNGSYFDMDEQQIHINNDESSAVFVSGDRAIQHVDFRNEVTFSDAPDVNDDFPCTISQISKDGIHWANLRHGKDKGQLQMTDLSSAKGPIYMLDLELSPCDEPSSRAASFSPDLCLLVVDAQVFQITKGIHGLTSVSFTIQYLPELLVRYRAKLSPRYWRQIRCLISPCNTYVIFISEGAPREREVAPSTIYAFRIDLVSKSSARLDLRLPKDLTFIYAHFHPSQQLMLLTHSSSFGLDDAVLEEMPSPQVSIVELEGLDMKPISLPKDELFIKHREKYGFLATKL